jgi:hypothetical protein
MLQPFFFSESRPRRHEYEKRQILVRLVPDPMGLSRPCDYGFAHAEFALLATDMKHTFSPQHEVNFVRCRMTVNLLILSGFQAV